MDKLFNPYDLNEIAKIDAKIYKERSRYFQSEWEKANQIIAAKEAEIKRLRHLLRKSVYVWADGKPYGRYICGACGEEYIGFCPDFPSHEYHKPDCEWVKEMTS